MTKLSNRIKKPRNKLVFRGHLKNDLEFVDPIHLRTKIHEQSHFSILYFTLLISSVIVVTLGLLTDNTAIVIGGMLIAPLMWPLARLGFGVAHRAPQHLYRGLLLILVSVLVGAASAYLITTISPIKVINDEILARTSPTLMDLFIALAAGLVAAIAITQKKIADSLAGVAIAVSLMPPLCTVGIALSLRNVPYSLGALLLFAVNAACITLVTTIVFVWTQYARKERVKVATRAAMINLIFVIVLSVPLVQFLRSYSFELQSYSVITNYMNQFVDNKDPTAEFEQINIEQTDRDTLSVSADLLLPIDIAFTFEDNELLVSELQNLVNKTVLLNLRIQQIIEPISKDQRDNETFISQLNRRLAEELAEIDTSYVINASSVVLSSDEEWLISAEVLTSPDAVPTTSTVNDLSNQLTQEVGQPVRVNVTFIPRLTLRSNEQTLLTSVQETVENITKSRDANAQVNSFILNTNDESNSISFTITTTNPDVYAEDFIDQLRVSTEQQLGGPVQLRVRLITALELQG